MKDAWRKSEGLNGLVRIDSTHVASGVAIRFRAQKPRAYWLRLELSSFASNEESVREGVVLAKKNRPGTGTIFVLRWRQPGDQPCSGL
jgi:hypothetical protein